MTCDVAGRQRLKWTRPVASVPRLLPKRSFCKERPSDLFFLWIPPRRYGLLSDSHRATAARARWRIGGGPGRHGGPERVRCEGRGPLSGHYYWSLCLLGFLLHPFG